MDRKLLTAWIAVGVDVFLIALKSILAFFTGSLALAADALHSLSDLLVSLGVMAAIWLRNRFYPAAANAPHSDAATHPGFWIEALVAALVALVILSIPLSLLAEINQPAAPVQNPWLGIIGVLLSIAVIYFVSQLKINVGRETDSPALAADGYHSQMDIFTSVVVLISLVGAMVGLPLDRLATVIIAVFILVIGIELFISSLITLFKRSELQELSLWQWLVARLTAFWQGLRQRLWMQGTLAYFRRPLGWLTVASVLALAYAASGFKVVAIGETGVQLRFGQVLADDLPPGLHYHLPWPIETLVPVDTGSTRMLRLGFADDAATRPGIWQTEAETAAEVLLTGDENVIATQVVLHYDVTDAGAYLFAVADMEAILSGLLQASLRTVAASTAADALLTTGKPAFLAALQQQLQQSLVKQQLGVTISGLYLHTNKPPLAVLETYHQAFQAREDKAEKISDSQGQRLKALADARAQGKRTLLEARAKAAEIIANAEGEVSKFSAILAAQSAKRQAYSFRRYVDTMEQHLQKSVKIITDPRLPAAHYLYWLFATDEGPLKISPPNRRIR